MMPLKIEVKGIKELQAGLDDIIKHRMPNITALALTETAKAVREESKKEMSQIFDRPTPFILGSQWIKAATKEDLSASVEWRSRTRKQSGWDAVTKALSPHIEGGSRTYKNFELMLSRMGILPPGYYAIPGAAAEMDPYGNMSRSQIIQIVSYFKAFPNTGYKANTSDKKRLRLAKGSKKAIGFAYFVGRPGGGRLPLGIYRRFHSTINVSALHPLQPILIFTRTPFYPKRWDIQGMAQRVVDRDSPQIFRRLADETLAYWRQK